MAEATGDSPEQRLERQAERAREVEHRVKNTLQLISSIVLLQGRRAQDDAAKLALKAVQQRVAAVSVAHRHVDWDEAGEQVELAGLIREIVSDLAGSAGRDGVTIDLVLEPASIAGRQAAPVALLVSEIVGNALRHAFPDGHAGRVRVGLRRAPGGLELEVADDGVGMAEGAAAAGGGGFGLNVAQLMAQQLRGKLLIEPGQPGARLTVTIPMDTPTAAR